MTRRILALAAAATLLAGCSSFNLGGVAYCPHGQVCTFSVQPPPDTTPETLDKGTAP